MYKHFFAIILIFATVAHASAQKKASVGKRERFVDSLIQKMTIEEKIGQMTQFTSDWDVTGPTMRQGYKDDIRAGKVGSIFNAFTAKYTRDLQRIAVEETRMHIPLIFGYDVIHGHRTIFPIPLGEAASWDLAGMEQSARIAATEAAAEGIHWTFAPMVDVARDPRWGRVAEGAGEDTYLGTLIAKARVRGFQGAAIGDPASVVACAKHYAAYGAAQAGRDYSTVDMSLITLHETYLPPFKACVDAGVGTFMTSFNEINGVPSTGNPYLLRDILRKQWGFKGFVVTDYTAINEMVNHGNVRDDKHAGETALNAGVDMDMQGAVFNTYLKKSLEEGKVSIKDIDQAVRNILLMKYDLGLFSDPYRYCNEEREKAVVMCQAHLDAARALARKSFVLLKNEQNTLPLKKQATIAVLGPLADARREMIGNWSAAGDWQKSVTMLEGIKQVAPGATLLYAKGCNINDDSTQYFQQALDAAKKADVVVLALGESGGMSGEASSRSDIGLPGLQQRLFDEVRKLGKPVVVVLMNGRPLAIPVVAEKADAILETWFSGTMGGLAIADVLFGDYAPSGRLPMTFPRSVGQVPLFYNQKNTGRPFDANNKYSSKYLDIPNTPQYPFGFGLSYTTFAYSDLKLSAKTMRMTDSVTVSVVVKNTGSREGVETVQLYTRDMVGSLTRPLRELKGFRQISLKPGESQTVSFTLKAKDLTFCHPDLSFSAEPGEFRVFIGPDSASGLSDSFELLAK